MAKSTYRFKTVMVEDADRDSFTAIRETLSKELDYRVTDKELFSALFGTVDINAAKVALGEKRKAIVAARAESKIEKLKAKLAELESAEADSTEATEVTSDEAGE